MRFAVHGYVTTSGTLVIYSPDVSVPRTRFRDEAYIFFSHTALFNRVTRDHLDVVAGNKPVVRHYRYTVGIADRDFMALRSEV